MLDALFGIEREVFESVRPGLDHHVAHTRLQWWREECERAPRGGAAHPLTRSLVTALGDPQAKAVPQLAGLCGIVDVATWDLANATFETRRELEAYCQRWTAAMIEPLIPSARRSAAWRELGAAICEIELLAGLARDAHSGRIRLPLDELDSANVDANALARQPWPETAGALIRSRLSSLRADIERSVSGSSREEQQSLRGLLVWAALSRRAAQRMEGALPHHLQPGRLDGIREAWYAWRIGRRATVGRFKLE